MMSAAAGTMPIAGEPQEALAACRTSRGRLTMSAATSTTPASLANSLGCTPWPPTIDPAAGAVDDAADAGHEDEDEAGEGEPRERHGGLAEPGVVDAREHEHGAHAEHTHSDLAVEEVEAGAVLEVGLGGRGAVGHDEAVDDEQER